MTVPRRVSDSAVKSIKYFSNVIDCMPALLLDNTSVVAYRWGNFKCQLGVAEKTTPVRLGGNVPVVIFVGLPSFSQ